MTMKLCKCGCGQVIPERYANGRLTRIEYINIGHFWKGKKRVGEHRDQHSIKNNNYKGGRVTIGLGYVGVECIGHPKATKKGNYVPEHVLVMEEHLGRFLVENERVHHINGDRQDNRLENLKLMLVGEHSKNHRLKELQEGKILFGGGYKGKHKHSLN